jgi:hypothetical protein
MDKNWLHQYLSDAVGRRLCAKIGCTTCGAYDFRNGVYRALERSRGATLPLDKSEAAREVVIALAQLTPEVHEWMQIRFEDAVRCLLYDLWYGRPAHVDGLEVLLEESWAGSVLQSMKGHNARVMAARRARADYESPEAAGQRREEKRRIKREAHLRRLERKVERDWAWRASNADCPPSRKLAETCDCDVAVIRV